MGHDQSANQLAPAFDDFGLELAPGDIALGATAAGAAYYTLQYVGTGGLGLVLPILVHFVPSETISLVVLISLFDNSY